MAKNTKKKSNLKKDCQKAGLNIGKPVVFMVVVMITCICMAFSGFIVGYNVGGKNAPAPEEEPSAECEDGETDCE